MLKGKKILYLGNLNSPHCFKLAEFYSNNGYEIHSLSIHEVEKKVSKVHYHHIIRISEKKRIKNLILLISTKFIKLMPAVIYYHCLDMIFNKLGFYKEIDILQPDMIHAHFATEAGYIAYKYGKIKYVVSCWGSDVLIKPEKSKYVSRILTKILNQSYMIHTSASQLTEKLKSKYSIPGKKIIEIQYGLEKKVVEFLRTSYLTKNITDINSIITTRRANKVYNNETFIQAARICQEKNLPFEFVIITGGIYFKKYKRMISNLKLNNIKLISFLPQKEMYKYLIKADVYISTALSDGLSLCLLEAFSAGLFPIVSDIRGNRNVIRDNGNGFLFPTRDPQALVNAILKLKKLKLDDRKEILDRNFKYVQDNQILENNLKELERLYL